MILETWEYWHSNSQACCAGRAAEKPKEGWANVARYAEDVEGSALARGPVLVGQGKGVVFGGGIVVQCEWDGRWWQESRWVEGGGWWVVAWGYNTYSKYSTVWDHV
jgi:hypothetical protein